MNLCGISTCSNIWGFYKKAHGDKPWQPNTSRLLAEVNCDVSLTTNNPKRNKNYSKHIQVSYLLVEGKNLASAACLQTAELSVNKS